MKMKSGKKLLSWTDLGGHNAMTTSAASEHRKSAGNMAFFADLMTSAQLGQHDLSRPHTTPYNMHDSY